MLTSQEAALVNLLGFILIIIFVVWIIRVGVSGGIRHANKGSTLPRLPDRQIQPEEEDGPGMYELKGVDISSKMDTVWVCRADSRANAEVKGKLEGIEVTKIRKL